MSQIRPSATTNSEEQSPYLKSLVTALPPHHIDQTDAAELAQMFVDPSHEKRRLIPVLYRRSGVSRRSSVLLETSSGDSLDRQSFYEPVKSAEDRGPTLSERMKRYEADARILANRTAAESLDCSGISPEEITHLVTVSCTGFHAPGFDIGLINDLGLNRNLHRTHVGFMGCHGVLNGLRVMRAFLESDPEACVMLCAAELCTLHYRYGWENEQVVANSLFADGAACLIVRARDLQQTFPGDCVLTANKSFVFPGTEDLMSWKICDHGFEMSLSARLPEVINRELRPWLQHWLNNQGLEIEDVGAWAIHPGGPRILQACQKSLGLDDEALNASRSVLEECGNMSSPTVLFILQRLREMQSEMPCVMLGFGPGITVEAALWC